jgi:hypothetical protein
MIRGQLCLYVQRTDRHGWAAAGGVGIVEAPVGTFRPERILSFQGACLDGGHLLSLGEYDRNQLEYHGEEISHHVVYAIWPRPAPESGVPGGGIAFRHTRVQAPPGREVMTFAICAYAPEDAFVGQRLYSVTGRDRPDMLVVHDPAPCEPLAENGIGMAALLKRPVWGWGDERFGLQSTMRLDVIDEARELRALMDASTTSAADDARIAELRHGQAWNVLRAGRDEPMFDEFRRRMGAEHPYDDWSKPVTAAQDATRRARAEGIVHELMAEGLSR